MATKKQKRAVAEAKREKFLADLKRENQMVLDRVRAKRDQKNRESWREVHDKSHSWRKLVDECPFCQDRAEEAKKQAWLMKKALRESEAS